MDFSTWFIFIVWFCFLFLIAERRCKWCDIFHLACWYVRCLSATAKQLHFHYWSHLQANFPSMDNIPSHPYLIQVSICLNFCFWNPTTSCYCLTAQFVWWSMNDFDTSSNEQIVLQPNQVNILKCYVAIDKSNINFNN